MINCSQFNIVGDGKTDNTKAMQAAHASGAVIYYPGGQPYLFSGNVQIPAGGISGDGRATQLRSTDTSSAAAITFTGNGQSNGGTTLPLFEKFSLLGPNTSSVVKQSGAGINFVPAGGDVNALQGFTLAGLFIQGFPVGIDTNNTSSWKLMGCDVYFFSQAGIVVQKTASSDVGDSAIVGCMFFNGNGPTYAGLGSGVLQNSGGGLKISATKFNGGAYGYQLAQVGQTSDILIGVCSFENASIAGVDFQNQANTYANPVRWSNIVISGSQFAGNARDFFLETIADYLNTAYWDNVNVSGCVFYSVGQSHPSVELNTCRGVYVGANAFDGAATAILAQATAAGAIGANAYRSVAAQIVNLAGSAVTGP